MSKLSIVATPIGNLGDITFRAVQTLKEADFVLCEDTRVTRKLLDNYEIKTPTISYHAHSGPLKIEEIIDYLKDDKNLALVSDAGTPGISDPGSELVSRVRDELKDMVDSGGLKIESVPGPSALTTALSIAGVIMAEGFTFLGFLPHKKGRETLFKEIAVADRPMVFYESPHRISKTLASLEKHLNGENASKNKKITVCRELTKIFEEVVAGSAGQVKEYFDKNLDKMRGEFVVIVS